MSLLDKYLRTDKYYVVDYHSIQSVEELPLDKIKICFNNGNTTLIKYSWTPGVNFFACLVEEIKALKKTEHRANMIAAFDAVIEEEV